MVTFWALPFLYYALFPYYPPINTVFSSTTLLLNLLFFSSTALGFFVTPYWPAAYYFLAYRGLYGLGGFVRASLLACVLSPTLPKYG
jgi:hypothetical protein